MGPLLLSSSAVERYLAGEVLSCLSMSDIFKNFFTDVIAIARGRFESFTIEYRELSALVSNQTILLQFVRGHRDSRPASPQHLRQRFMR